MDWQLPSIATELLWTLEKCEIISEILSFECIRHFVWVKMPIIRVRSKTMLQKKFCDDMYNCTFSKYTLELIMIALFRTIYETTLTGIQSPPPNKTPPACFWQGGQNTPHEFLKGFCPGRGVSYTQLSFNVCCNHTTWAYSEGPCCEVWPLYSQ